MANQLYECSNIVEAFEDLNDAGKLLAKCNTYSQTRPRFDEPEFPIGSDEYDVNWNKFERKLKNWCKKHPAGKQNSDGDDFSLLEVKFTRRSKQ